mmetsp:Transcript_46198/g.88166  ORF Transcript_46198/g.88166 Transcript_46198/m.88166 type:complete len:211 (+) Transcript_46198:1278-1910(+)
MRLKFCGGDYLQSGVQECLYRSKQWYVHSAQLPDRLHNPGDSHDVPPGSGCHHSVLLWHWQLRRQPLFHVSRGVLHDAVVVRVHCEVPCCDLQQPADWSNDVHASLLLRVPLCWCDGSGARRGVAVESHGLHLPVPALAGHALVYKSARQGVRRCGSGRLPCRIQLPRYRGRLVLWSDRQTGSGDSRPHIQDLWPGEHRDNGHSDVDCHW